MTTVTNVNWKALRKHPGRHAAGEGGLFLKVLDEARAHWVYRYRFDAREHEASLGSAHKLDYAAARTRHLELRKRVEVDGINPLAQKRAAKQAAANVPIVPTFGEMADQYIAQHEAGWKNDKHAAQWRMTLTRYCAPIRDLPVDKVDAKAVLSVLSPIWTTTPETASRLRGRIEAVLASAQVAGCIDPDRPNPARWKGWLAEPRRSLSPS